MRNLTLLGCLISLLACSASPVRVPEPAPLDASRPWFQYADSVAAPRRVHLAKSMVMFEPGVGWTRNLEVDGHDVSYQERNWQAGVAATQIGYLVRYAVFEFPPNSETLKERTELEKAIRYFASHYTADAPIEPLMEDMAAAGFDLDMIAEVECISTIAFARHFFEPRGAQFSEFVFRARRDGRVESNVPLMSIPAFTRARALAPQLAETMAEEDFMRLCLYNAEAQAILQAMEHADEPLDLESITFSPSVVPERGVSEATFDRAMAMMQGRLARSEPVEQAKARKPWWKFWG